MCQEIAGRATSADDAIAAAGCKTDYGKAQDLMELIRFNYCYSSISYHKFISLTFLQIMNNNLTNKVAYITGGSKGIGYGVAKTLLQSGMRVAITSRNLQAAEVAAASLSPDTSKVLGLGSDVGSFASESAAVKAVLDHFGQLDVLVANAGVGHFAPIDSLTEEDWKATIDTNLTGVFNSVKNCINALKTSSGYIITIASLAGTNFFEQASAYNASKFGLVGFTQAVMLDLRKYGIKVTTIMPGSVATEFADHTPSDADAWKIQPEDIGKLVLDLLTMHPRTLPSKIEVRPLKPGKG
jgi:NAD(P)-dependent dehydrogenase (short-subunit alcohol dehydrogenase family)